MGQVEGRARRAWRNAWDWTGIGAEWDGRISLVVTVGGAVANAVVWLSAGYGFVITTISVALSVLVAVGAIGALRVVRRNADRTWSARMKAAQDGSSREAAAQREQFDARIAALQGEHQRATTALVNDLRVIPAGWSAIITGHPTQGTVLEVVPPGCHIVAAGPGMVTDANGNTAGAGTRMYNPGSGNFVMNGASFGTRPYPLYST